MADDFVQLNKIQIYITQFILLSLVVAIIFEIINKHFDLIFVTVLSMILIFIPYIFERRFRIYLPTEIQLAIVLFIYAAVFLGEAESFFIKFWWWDSLLHLFSGFTIALIAFGIIYVLYKTDKIRTSPLFICVLIFSIAITIGTMWEIYEFTMDNTFGLDMQKARNLCPATGHCDSRLGVFDTMKDLILNTIGAMLASVLSYVYLKRGKSFLLSGLIDKFVKNNPKLFYK